MKWYLEKTRFWSSTPAGNVTRNDHSQQIEQEYEVLKHKGHLLNTGEVKKQQQKKHLTHKNTKIDTGI